MNAVRLMYHTAAYARFLEAALPGTSVHRIEVPDGVLSYARRDDARFGTVFNSLPFFGSHGGPCATTADARVELLRQFRDACDAARAVSVTLIEDLFAPLTDAEVALTDLEPVDDRIGQVTLLPAGAADVEADLMARFHQKTRNAIRKGQKLRQRVERRVDADAWHWMQGVHQRSIESLGGVPKSLHVFDALRSAFGDDARLYVGSVDGRPLSGVVVIVYQGTVEYFTPVVEEAERDTQALSATVYEVMRRLTDEGCTLWNWGGTWRSQEGVYRFKSRWGAEDRPYRYFNRADAALRAAPRAEVAAAFPFFYLYRY